MSRIEFEDRTTEAPEASVNRHVEAVSRAIIITTIHASQGNPSIGMAALVRSVAQGAARTGASLDEVMVAIRRHYESALQEMALGGPIISDA